MPEDDEQRVSCPGCGRGYRWRAELAGRRVPCKQCGVKFVVPDGPGVGLAVSDQATTTPPPAPRPEPKPKPADDRTKCPSCNSPMKREAVICMNCGFNLTLGRKVDAPEVVEMPAEEKKAIRRELSGMKWVRYGLWLNLLSIVIVALTVPGVIGAALMGFDFELVAEVAVYLALGCALAGSLMCLAVPKAAGGPGRADRVDRLVCGGGSA